jgi:predicted glycogen debranching enzyme
MIDFTGNECADLDRALGREWLETNGIGGFASSTIVGINTRRYHGLLIAATRPPVGRLVMLSKLEEVLTIAGQSYELAANQYPGVVHPNGHTRLKRFRLDPFPIFTYDLGAFELDKAIFMLHGSNTTVVRYRLRSTDTERTVDQGGPPETGVLEVRPLFAYRDYHALGRENGNVRSAFETAEGLVSIAPYEGLPALHLAHTARSFEGEAYWYRNFEYMVEQERGFEFHEDLFSPFALRFDLDERADAVVIASTDRHDVGRAAEFEAAEIARRASLVVGLPSIDIVQDLARAADQYVVSRDQCKSVIAGYHWFGDWGRDTMIALPGLTLVTGRYDVARSILREFAAYADRGMLPNRFPDAGETPEYNNVDSTLWFFEAVRAYLAYTSDYSFVETYLYDTLADIVSWHVTGTRYGIRVDQDGLLAAGEEGVQLTWMDAKVGDWVVTPRRGKAVEIQALWYNALRVMEDLADRFGDKAGSARAARMADQARESFEHLFWNEGAGCLYDAIDGGERDGSLRPNQILAVSLTHSMLSPERAKQVVEVVERELLTPVGLRSLARDDARYCPRYEGDGPTRDASYHQGTVWAWLFGPFVTAFMRVNEGSDEARVRAAAWIAGFREHLTEAGLGHISEIFDADAPHTPRGCAAQAWSVAEVLRCAAEDVFASRAQSAETTG